MTVAPLTRPLGRPALSAALLVGLLSACNSSPVATTPVVAPRPAATSPVDSAALPSAAPAATGPAVPFVGKPGLKAILRSGELVPGAASSH